MADGIDITVQQSPSSESSPAAYQRLLPKILAIQDPRPVNVDVMYVVTLILGSSARIRTLHAQLLRLPDFDGGAVEELDDMARALQHAHGLYLQATKSPQALQSLLERATVTRDVLLADALALAKRGILNADSFREVKRTGGHRGLVVDLQILVATFREKLAEIAGRSSVNALELDSAVALIDTLTEAIGTKEHSPAMREESIQIRAKALELVLRTYEEVRSGLAYVRRREGDAESIAPSPYSNRVSSARSAASDSDESATTGVHPVAQPAAPDVSLPSVDLSAQLAQNGPFKRSGSEG